MPELTMNDAIATIKRAGPRPFVLFGLVGVGKSKLGRGIARVLDIPFYDNDQEVEAAAGCPLSEIIDRFGVDQLRAAELRVFRRLLERGPCVIAVGDGAALNSDFIQVMFDRATTMWVRAELAVMVDRNSRLHTRPHMRGVDVQGMIQELIAARYPVYERADVVVTSDDVPATQTLHHALNELAAFMMHAPLRVSS